jgi:putative flippase GtrA
MIDWMKKQFQKYRDIILYLFFGGCTTVLNIAVYYLCYNIAGIPNVPSTCIAWILSVLFAYLTNKVYVFQSRSFQREVLLREGLQFFGCRLLTGILDVAIMFVAVDLLHWNGLLWKVISNVLVIILNYVASKLLIFKK